MNRSAGASHSARNTAPLIRNMPGDLGDLEQRMLDAFQSRLSGMSGECTAASGVGPQITLSAHEVETVSNLARPLFPPGFLLPESARESMQLLCRLSQTQLRPASAITSHRRFLGPVIVFVKRLSWPLIQIHLKETFSSFHDLHCQMVDLTAKLLAQTEQSRQALDRLQETVSSAPSNCSS